MSKRPHLLPPSSSTPMPPNARRPGPLQELPLACFLPLDTNARPTPASPFKSSSKRSRSPSSLLSPTKRRILREEGYFGTASSESKRGTSKSRAAVGQPCGEVLRSGRRLDFGSLSNPSGSSIHELDDSANPFHTPRASSQRLVSPSELPSPSLKSAASHRSHTLVGSDRAGTTATPIMIPRELPQRSNRQCCHYPGFDIHFDTHVELPCASARIAVDPGSNQDKDGSKENLPPRKKAKKAVSVPVEVGSSLPLSKIGDERLKAMSFPTTPSYKPRLTPSTPHVHDTPRASDRVAQDLSPAWIPHSGNEKLARKRAMEREVDEICSDDGGL
ncbi:hypothetical protein M0805_002446 [Coniferiporia weirii]|nr:hypothetical protein M0805_002446 [Coniferiporia weirii]